MCGLAGIAGPVDRPHERVQRMCDKIRHRGPDSNGQYVVPGRIALGFRRLSIIDLTTGDQPIFNEDRSVAVTCNGEIYNFRALRDELTARGHRFSTVSDTEVIVHLYEEEGPDCVRRLQGMFAIALWDEREQRLMLARDRLGVKPLYWAVDGQRIVYGSEPGAVLAAGIIPAIPDPAALVESLSLQYVQAPRSGFKGIHKLRPGERLLFDGGMTSVSTYWSLDDPREPFDGDEADALVRLDELMRDATGCRLIADVPVGAFLSGGVDSSVVVAYMASLMSEVRTFSIDFPVQGFSEAAHARRVSSIYGTRHVDLLVEPDVVPLAADAAKHAGEPFADSSAIPTYLLSEMTRRDVTVALSGDGGDEAFGGYTRYRIAVAAQRYDPVARGAGMLGRRVMGRIAGSRYPRIVRAFDALARSPHERYASMMVHFDPPALTELCAPEFLLAAGGSRTAYDDILRLPDLPGVDRYRRLDQRTYLPGDILTKVDRMSMTHSLEVRSPMLDYRVHEFTDTLPPEMKLRRGETKWLLRRLALQLGLPNDLVNRPKQGFGIPIGHWFRTGLRSWLLDVLRDPKTTGRGLFDQSVVDRLIDEHLDQRRDHTSRLWNLLMLELWHRHWIDDSAT